MNSLTSLAAQFAKANRDEQRWLREEIQQWKTLVMAIIQENGGELKISKRSLDSVRPCDTISITEDKLNRCLILKEEKNEKWYNCFYD